MAFNRVMVDRVYDYYKNYNSESVNKSEIRRIYDELSYYDQFKVFFSKPTHIVDNIYLGSAFNSCDKNTINNLNIGLIINVSSEIRNHFEKDIEYLKINIYDDNEQSIKEHLNVACNKILEFTNNPNNINKSVLIHCFMGASRSASVIIYYLIKIKKYSLFDAIEYVRNKRTSVNLSVQLFNDLLESVAADTNNIENNIEKIENNIQNIKKEEIEEID